MIHKISNGVNLTCIKSNKFKDICLSINFITNNENKSASERALLSMMFVDRCQTYNTKKKMNDVCDHLYGCTLGSRVVTYGKGHCIELRSKIIDPEYIHENHNILNDWFNFIHEIIFNPLINEEVFNENKTILKSRIKRREDDSQAYTVSKLFELVGENQPLSIHVRGDLSTLDSLTLYDIQKQYEELISNNQIEILICGNFDENQIMKYINSKLKFNDRDHSIQTNYVIPNQDFGIKSEEKIQPQTNIAMAYSTSIDVNDDDYPALKVCNGIFGQLPSSYLFQVIREQHSLCYSISSNLISYDGVCLVTTGIEKENIEQTLSLIDEQLEKCQHGEFSDELLDVTKTMLVNGLRNSLDEMSSVIGYAFTNSILKRNYPIEKNIESVMKVTREDCIRVFNKIKHMGTYICESKENDDE